MTRRLTPAQLQRIAAAQAPLLNEALADLRRDRGVETICRIGGPRIVAELLNAIGAKCSCGTVIDQEVARFARLDPVAIAAIGADRLQPAPLTVIEGGKVAGVTKGNRLTKDNLRGGE